MHPRLQRLLAAALSQAPTLLILAALAGLAAWGHHTGWKFPKAEEEQKKSDGAEAGSEKKRKPIELESAEAVKKAGIETEPAGRRTMEEYVVASGEIDFYEPRLAHLSTRAAGTVWSVEAHEGDPVKKGDVLAIVASADVARLKNDFQQMLLQVEAKDRLLRDMQETPSISDQVVRQTKVALREAKIRLYNDEQSLLNLGLPVQTDHFTGLSDEAVARRLRWVGIPPDVIDKKKAAGAHLTANLLPMYAPFDGLVIHHDIVIGEYADMTKTQYTVADVRNLWVMLNVRVEDVGRLRLGQKVRFQPDGVSEEAPPAQLAWISAEVDEKTRYVRARANVPNPDGKLRRRMFGAGRVAVQSFPDAVVVPEAAVQWDVQAGVEGQKRTPLVFVRDPQKKEVFHPREVTLGVHHDGYYQIVSGVAAGEPVVITGSHVLKSEMLKERIGGDD